MYLWDDGTSLQEFRRSEPRTLDRRGLPGRGEAPEGDLRGDGRPARGGGPGRHPLRAGGRAGRPRRNGAGRRRWPRRRGTRLPGPDDHAILLVCRLAPRARSPFSSPMSKARRHCSTSSGPSAYAAELALHHSALRHAWQSHQGVEIDTQGDSFFVAFSRAGDAVEAARAAQAVLQRARHPVRMGIHTGEPLLTKDGYVGMDVHRAARIAAAGSRRAGSALARDPRSGRRRRRRRRPRRAPAEGPDEAGAHLSARPRLVSPAAEPEQVESAGDGASARGTCRRAARARGAAPARSPGHDHGSRAARARRAWRCRSRPSSRTSSRTVSTSSRSRA